MLGLCAPFLGSLFLLLFLNWFLIPQDGRRIPSDVLDELIGKVFFYRGANELSCRSRYGQIR